MVEFSLQQAGGPRLGLTRAGRPRARGRAREAVAVEDSANRARSAVAAGYPTVGILQLVPDADRPTRTEALHEAGVAAVVESWADAEQLLR